MKSHREGAVQDPLPLSMASRSPSSSVVAFHGRAEPLPRDECRGLPLRLGRLLQSRDPRSASPSKIELGPAVRQVRDDVVGRDVGTACGPGRDGRFLAFVMRRLPKDSDRETLNSNKSCLRIAREFIPRLDVAAETMIERIDPPAPGGPPYSGVVVAGPLVFVAGQVGSDPRTGAVPAGVKAQTQVVLSNIEAKLKKAGCGLEDVVKSTAFLADIRGSEELNAGYRTAVAP